VPDKRRTWLDGRVDALLDALAEFDIEASRESVAALIQERVEWIAQNMRVTPLTARRYLTDEAVRDLAKTMVVSIADEAPGSDVLTSPRSAALPVSTLGRAVAALAEAVMLRLDERDDLAHVRATTTQLAQVLSALGQVAADRTRAVTTAGAAGPGVVMMPPALLNRAARYLEAAALVIRTDGVLPAGLDAAAASQLADAFDMDAVSLRAYADGA
jgi:hypothetical protein